MRNFALLAIVTSTVLLAGCTSSAQRQAECEAQGISKDTCYLAEQNRKTSINAAAQKQAMENAQALYPVQKAQAAKVRVLQGYGTTVKIIGEQVTVNGKPAVLDETTTDAKTYSQGLYTIILYKKTGKVALMQENQLVGYLK